MRGQWLGVFDSGVGGLTVAQEIVRVLPAADMVYLGDTARVPYGSRSPDTVRRYARGCARALSELGLRALVVACNTASAVALDALAGEFDGPVLGVVRPGAARAVAATRTGHVAVLATRTTTASGAYVRALKEAASGGTRDIRATALSCPLFVPLAEEGWIDGDVPAAAARRYLAPLAGTDVDTLVLGCTHYPLLAGVIRAAAEDLTGRPLTVIDSAAAVASALASQVGGAVEGQGRRRFLVTDDPASFAAVAPRFFGAETADLHHIDVVPA